MTVKFPKHLVEAACNSIKIKAEGKMREIVKDPKAVIIRYNDGLKGAILDAG